MRSVYEYPYTNYHDINLDWIVGQVKKLSSVVNSTTIADMVADGRIGATIQRFVRTTDAPHANLGYNTIDCAFDDVAFANHGEDFFSYDAEARTITIGSDGLYDVAYSACMSFSGSTEENPNHYYLSVTHEGRTLEMLANIGHGINDSKGSEMVRYMYAGDTIKLSGYIYSGYSWKGLTNAHFPTYLRVTKIL